MTKSTTDTLSTSVLIREGAQAAPVECDPRSAASTPDARPTARRRHYRFAGGVCTRTPLYAYQAVGVVRVARALRASKSFGLLDACGLGKTIQSLYAMADLKAQGVVDKIIVVCKCDLIRNWKQEAQAHVPWLRVCVLRGKSSRERKWSEDADLYLINYELLAVGAKGRTRDGLSVRSPFRSGTLRLGVDATRMRAVLRRWQCGIVLDESHKIKSMDAQTTKVLCALGPLARARLILTGTLAAEGPEDVWSQIHFLDGGATFGRSFRAFRDYYMITDQRVLHLRGGTRRVVYKVLGYKNLNGLREKLGRITLRREKSGVLGLPPKILKRRYVTASSSQLALLRAIRDRIVVTVKGTHGEYVNVQRGSNLMQELQALQQQ